jgi:hypothetical protein
MKKEQEEMSLEHLFDAELQHREGMAPVTSDGEGELIVSGEGVAHPELTGFPISIPDAIDAGRTVFAGLLKEP